MAETKKGVAGKRFSAVFLQELVILPVTRTRPHCILKYMADVVRFHSFGPLSMYPLVVEWGVAISFHYVALFIRKLNIIDFLRCSALSSLVSPIRLFSLYRIPFPDLDSATMNHYDN
jgi:hypothetical protein